MPWFKLDDGFASHRKVAQLFEGPCPGDSIALFVLAGTWCARELTDGAVPVGFVVRSGMSKKAVGELVRVKLFDVVESGGYALHNYLKYNPTRKKVLADREATKRRVNEHRNKDRNGVTPPATPGDTNGVGTSPPVPGPVPPSPEGEGPHDLGPDQPTDFDATFSALRQGYGERFERKTGGMWMSAARNDREMRDVTRWAMASADKHALGAGQIVHVALEEFFADTKAERATYPWTFLAKNPDEYFLRDRRIQSHIATRQQGGAT